MQQDTWNNKMITSRILIETILVTAVTLLGMWFLPVAKTLFALLPVVYLLLERRLRKRTWGELGFSLRTFWADLRANWILFLLLGFVIQPAIALWAKTNFPGYLAHVQARLPFERGIGWAILLPLLAVSLVGEEMTYRTLIQGRLVLFIGSPAAVGVASALFGLAHFAPGPGLVVLTDVGLIVVDSILYGVMFARRNNLWVVWLAHLLGDISGLLVLNSI
jgi:membrane protease YdiL (CAAX protease family)